MNPYFEDSTEEQADTQPGTPEAPQQEAQSPLLLSDMQNAEEIYAMPRAGRGPRQAVVAVLLVLGAIGAIFAMRHFGMGPAGALAQVDMDYKPTGNTTGISQGKVLADLERSRRAVQVPAENIKQDPFELDNTGSEAAAPVVDPDLERKRREEALLAQQAAREAEIKAELDKLTLQSVMGGTVPIARINDEIYKVGSSVGEHFTIKSIEGRVVTLEAGNGRSFTLSMDDKPKPGGRKNPRGR